MQSIGESDLQCHFFREENRTLWAQHKSNINTDNEEMVQSISKMGVLTEWLNLFFLPACEGANPWTQLQDQFDGCKSLVETYSSIQERDLEDLPSDYKKTSLLGKFFILSSVKKKTEELDLEFHGKDKSDHDQLKRILSVYQLVMTRLVSLLSKKEKQDLMVLGWSEEGDRYFGLTVQEHQQRLTNAFNFVHSHNLKYEAREGFEAPLYALGSHLTPAFHVPPARYEEFYHSFRENCRSVSQYLLWNVGMNTACFPPLLLTFCHALEQKFAYPRIVFDLCRATTPHFELPEDLEDLEDFQHPVERSFISMSPTEVSVEYTLPLGCHCGQIKVKCNPQKMEEGLVVSFRGAGQNEENRFNGLAEWGSFIPPEQLIESFTWKKREAEDFNSTHVTLQLKDDTQFPKFIEFIYQGLVVYLRAKWEPQEMRAQYERIFGEFKLHH